MSHDEGPNDTPDIVSPTPLPGETEATTKHTTKTKRVKDDFFAFHLEEDSKPKKKKKKKLKLKPKDNSFENSPGDTSQDGAGNKSQEVTPKKNKKAVTKQARDVTPPPVETAEFVNYEVISSSRDLVDDLVLGTTRPMDDEYELNIPLESSIPITDLPHVVKPKIGVKDKFKLTLDMTMIGVNSSLELMVKGSSRVEKILHVLFDYMKLSPSASSDVILVYDEIKLLNATQICNLLIIDKKLQMDPDNIYNVNLTVIRNADYIALKREKQMKFIENDGEIEELKDEAADDDEKFQLLNLHELEKLASKSLKNQNSLNENDDGNAFSITLRSSAKSKLVISIHPEMRINEIQKIAQEKFEITKNCKLVFDDEELNLNDLVRDTELEEDYIIDVVTV